MQRWSGADVGEVVGWLRMEELAVEEVGGAAMTSSSRRCRAEGGQHGAELHRRSRPKRRNDEAIEGYCGTGGCLRPAGDGAALVVATRRR